MKLRTFSDLHTEFSKFKIPELPDDLETTLILAGDIGVGKTHRNWMEMICKKFKRVIYILGNHEFYHNEYFNVISQWREIEAEVPNLFFLHNEYVDFDGVRFIGGTLWTDFKNNDPLIMNHIANRMSDFQIISYPNDETSPYAHGPYMRFTPSNAFEEHVKAFKFIDKTLNKPFDGKTVIITHHAPSYGSVAEQYRGYDDYETNFGYFTDLDWMLEKYDITYWFHGHMHNSSDYEVGGSRVICNPRGYAPHELNPEFNSKLVLDI